jgi:hypothetical protein
MLHGLASFRLLLLLVLLFALLLMIGLAGALRGTVLGNGPVVVATTGGRAESVDPTSGAILATFPGTGRISGVGRSPDGRWVGYWANEGASHELWISRIDGTQARQVTIDANTASPLAPGPVKFSRDSRVILTELPAGGQLQLAVAHLDDAAAVLLGPADDRNYLVSPDGTSIAFVDSSIPKGRDAISVMATDGTGAHPTTDDRLVLAHGADGWSSDGAWIYFGAAAPLEPAPRNFSVSNGVFRVHLADDHVERLTGPEIYADSPALSPDDSQVAYLVSTAQQSKSDLWVMDADGSHPRLLATAADIRGWSADSRNILAEVTLWSCSAELVSIPVVGTAPTTMLRSDDCTDGWHFGDVSWGFPRP